MGAIKTVVNELFYEIFDTNFMENIKKVEKKSIIFFNFLIKLF